jgi:signal transduction histidine kinase
MEFDAGRARAGTAPSPTYRGHDRRAPVGWVQPHGRQLRLAIALLVVVTVAAGAIAVAQDRPRGVNIAALNVVLATACAVVAVVAGFISCQRWRMSGNASALRIGAALLLLGALVVAIAIVPYVDGGFPPAPALAQLDAAMWLTVVGLLALAVVAPSINSAASGARLLACVLASVGALLLAVYAVPPLASAVQSTTGRVEGAGDLVAHFALVAFWVILATVALARGMRSSSWLWTWLGLMLFGFAAAGVLKGLATSRHDLFSTGALAVRLLALLFVLNGVAQELKLAFFDQRAVLFDTRMNAELTELRRRIEQAERAERDHEARSAILGIEAATRHLTVDAEEIASESSAELRAALDTEIELLRILVEGERSELPCVAFDVAAAVSPVVVCTRASGTAVTAELGDGVRAFGRPAVLTEVVQGLLDNARDHAGGPIAVRAAYVGGDVEVRVEDRGPGVAPAQRERIFRRGVSSGPAGRGLGLSIARSLLFEQDGDIQVEDRPGGGASFVVRLPAASPGLGPRAAAQLLHDVDERRELGDREPLHAGGGHERADVGISGPVREPDHATDSHPSRGQAVRHDEGELPLVAETPRVVDHHDLQVAATQLARDELAEEWR